MKKFVGKTILITGAASGIGRCLALKLAEQGSHLYLVDINADLLAGVADEAARFGVRVWTRICDLSSPSSVDEMLADCLRQTDVLDGIINNAGVAYYGPTHAMTQQQWDWLMNINLLTPIRIVQHLLPHLMQRPDAHIVNMCSISGIVAGGRFAAYHASKFGLIGFTEAIRAEYGRKGIGVTAICPGPVRTNLYKAAVGERSDKKVPEPPGWLCAAPEKVAAVTLSAMQRNRRQVIITPLAHGLFQMKRFLPGVIDFANQFSRRKKRYLAELQKQEDARLAALQTTAAEPTHRDAA